MTVTLRLANDLGFSIPHSTQGPGNAGAFRRGFTVLTALQLRSSRKLVKGHHHDQTHHRGRPCRPWQVLLPPAPSGPTPSPSTPDPGRGKRRQPSAFAAATASAVNPAYPSPGPDVKASPEDVFDFNIGGISGRRFRRTGDGGPLEATPTGPGDSPTCTERPATTSAGYADRIHAGREAVIQGTA
jgi:hypothetical protein